MSILEDLYYGKVSPCDRDVRRGSKVDELQNLACQYEVELNSTLTEKQKEIFEKFKKFTVNCTVVSSEICSYKVS